MRATCFALIIVLHCVMVLTIGGQRRSGGPTLGRFLQPLFISSLLGPNILYTLRPNTINLSGLLSSGMKRGRSLVENF